MQHNSTTKDKKEELKIYCCKVLTQHMKYFKNTSKVDSDYIDYRLQIYIDYIDRNNIQIYIVKFWVIAKRCLGGINNISIEEVKWSNK